MRMHAVWHLDRALCHHAQKVQHASLRYPWAGPALQKIGIGSQLKSWTPWYVFVSLDGSATILLAFISGSQILGYASRHGGHALMLWCPMEWECRCNRKLEQPARRFQREGESMTTQTSMAMASNVDDQWGLRAKGTTPDPRAKRRKSVSLSSSPPPLSQPTSPRM